MSEETPPLDGKTLSDPTAWGFCDYCAFDVAVFDGLRMPHQRYRNSPADGMCRGSGQAPTMDSPLEAQARQTVKLLMSRDRLTKKGYWQRQRYAARATARERVRIQLAEEARNNEE